MTIVTADPPDFTEKRTEKTDASVMVIFGSSRSNGQTSDSVRLLLANSHADVIDLGRHKIAPFDYRHLNEQDDFYDISKKMLEADRIVFATPVYWYAMSAQMKTFFDRASDLITIRKKDGRALRGKETYLLANGSDPCLPDGFEIPFLRTSAYFDMDFRGSHYVYTGKDEQLKKTSIDGLKAFRQKIFSMPSPVNAVSLVVK